jgi:AcrR family transcriptional regulator
VPAVKAHNSDLATRLVDEAGRLLSDEGTAALSLRRLATATGTSTMAVYTLFGDKQGLLAAMYRAGFERLGAAMSSAVEGVDDPLAALAELGLAYRRAALANPHLYDLMFGRPVAAFDPEPADRETADSTFRPLVDGVQRCMDSGAIVAGDAERVASYLWAVSHGMVSLELAGQLADDAAARDAAYIDALIFSTIPFLPSP